ncbi:MAG TPA: hypothetical protein DCZ05_02380 [Deltaproteobacteria bacterium]|nr:hypothetical protein [Deltaproteobacteria bacterium]
MAYVMEMSFDNSHRLVRKRHLFEYRGYQFSLIQDNPGKHPDHLLTILPTYDELHLNAAFSVAAEFASAVCWQNNARVAIWESGGRSSSHVQPLARLQPSIFSLPRIPSRGNVVGYELTRLPLIETEAQRMALARFREGRASNNDYLSFLFFWQVLEVGGGNPIGFVDKALRKYRREIHQAVEAIDKLPLQGRSVGHYLYTDCRNVIAHFRPKSGAMLNLDARHDRVHLVWSTRAIEQFAKCYIRNVLGLKKYCYLVRKRRGAFPMYFPEDQLSAHRYRIAYPSPSWGAITGKLKRKIIK